MKVVEVGGEAKSLNGSLDVLLNVGRRVGHSTLSKHIETALRSDWKELVSIWVHKSLGLTENLVANVVFPNELSKELLVYTCLVDHLN